MDILQAPIYILENYGWYLLGIGAVLLYMYQNVLKSHINSSISAYKKQRDEEEYAAKYHKNPDLFISRQMAQQEYAMKLQEKYKEAAEEYERKMKEKERKKQEEFLQKFEGEGGQRSGYREDSTTNSSKPAYNPLMGAGSSSNYRPPRRSACSRGGCG